MNSNAKAIEPLLIEMYEQQSVLQGWDIVINLLESAISDFVTNQWVKCGNQSGSLIWCSDAFDLMGEHLSSVTQLGFMFSDPSVEFQASKASATIKFDIIGGELKTGILRVDDDFKPDECEGNIEDSRVKWGYSKSFDSSDKIYVACTVPFSLVNNETTTNIHSVSLNLLAGSFSLDNIKIDGVDASAITQKLKQWFVGKIKQFKVASFDSSLVREWIEPNSVNPEINVIETNDGVRLLQIFFGPENNSQSKSPKVEIEEPIPSESNVAFSVMINSRILIQDMVKRFNKGMGLVKLVAIAPKSPSGNYFAQVRNPMAYEGTVDFGGFYPEIKNHAELGMNFSGSPKNGLAISYYTSPGSNIDLQLKITGNYAVKIDGSGKNQIIRFLAGAYSVAATGLAENTVKPQLEDFLEGIKDDMNAITLDGFTKFVLQDMSFPGHFAEIKQAETPGDFIILGTLQKNDV